MRHDTRDVMDHVRNWVGKVKSSPIQSYQNQRDPLTQTLARKHHKSYGAPNPITKNNTRTDGKSNHRGIWSSKIHISLSRGGTAAPQTHASTVGKGVESKGVGRSWWELADTCGEIRKDSRPKRYRTIMLEKAPKRYRNGCKNHGNCNTMDGSQNRSPSDEQLKLQVASRMRF